VKMLLGMGHKFEVGMVLVIVVKQNASGDPMW